MFKIGDFSKLSQVSVKALGLYDQMGLLKPSSQVRNSLELRLGLYLCRKIIIAHGGEIGVISSTGAGATFWFTIPISK